MPIFTTRIVDPQVQPVYPVAAGIAASGATGFAGTPWVTLSGALRTTGGESLPVTFGRDTAITASDDPRVPCFRSGVFVAEITAIDPGVTLTVAIEGRAGSDLAASSWYPILTSAAWNAIGVYALRVGPGLAAIANLVANDVLPEYIRVTWTVAGAGAINYHRYANYVN